MIRAILTLILAWMVYDHLALFLRVVLWLFAITIVCLTIAIWLLLGT